MKSSPLVIIIIGKRFSNNIKVMNRNRTWVTTVSLPTGGRFGDSPSVNLHNDDISALLDVTLHHPMLTFINCLQAQSEKKGVEFNSSPNN